MPDLTDLFYLQSEYVFREWRFFQYFNTECPVYLPALLIFLVFLLLYMVFLLFSPTLALRLFLVILLFFLVFFFFSPVPTAELLISLVSTLNSCFVRCFSLFHQLSLKLS